MFGNEPIFAVDYQVDGNVLYRHNAKTIDRIIPWDPMPGRGGSLPASRRLSFPKSISRSSNKSHGKLVALVCRVAAAALQHFGF
jgi:hypothetical protein